MAEMVRLGVELLPEVFVGVVLPGAEAPHALNKRSHDRTVIKAVQWKKNVRFAYSFCAEQGKRDNIYPPLQKGLGGHSAGESFELEFIQLETNYQITNSQREVLGAASTPFIRRRSTGGACVTQKETPTPCRSGSNDRELLGSEAEVH